MSPQHAGDQLALAVAIADKSLSAVDFFRPFSSAVESGDQELINYACHGLIYKCMGLRTKEAWEELRTLIVSKFPDDERLVCIASAGKLFTEYDNPNRESERKDCTLWLVIHFPKDPCHNEPPIFNVADEHFSEVAAAWNAAVAAEPKNLDVIKNAASFFFSRDEKRCRDLYSAGAALDPANNWWSERLGKLMEFHLPQST